MAMSWDALAMAEMNRTRANPLFPPAPPSATASERARSTLARGVLVFRWVWLVWMGGLAVTGRDDFRRPGLAIASVALAVAWTVWMTATGKSWGRGVAAADLLLCSWLIVASGLVVDEGSVVAGRPFFATGYPLSSALLWGAIEGPIAGMGAGIFLGLAQIASRPVNGIALGDLSQGQAQILFGAAVNNIVAGVAVGLVSRVLTRSGREVEDATEALVAERERAARLSERESMARQIHDSTLQALAFIHKKGAALARRGSIAPEEVSELTRIAEKQEDELRALILREPEDAPTGTESLRASLESVARSIEGVPVSVGAVGPVWLPRHHASEIAAAVKQALENVVEHAEASKAVLFAETEDGFVIVSVRDDGKGFTYDEADLRRRSKAGLLMSIKGRIETLGGSVAVTTRVGRGTEIEMRVPMMADG